jgi:hypothetical protein
LGEKLDNTELKKRADLQLGSGLPEVGGYSGTKKPDSLVFNKESG